jgi:glycine/D-amino acid oxidase-like deaminating enzyme
MTPPWPISTPTRQELAAFADAVPRPFWLDDLPARAPHARLEGVVDADLCIVGGGYTGLWAALHAKRLDPTRSVVLVEGGRCGEGASGRNGGFLDASLTHGLINGLSRFKREMPVLERLGAENFAGLRADLETHGIDCEYEATGSLEVALEPYQVESLQEDAELERRFGHDVVVLDAAAVRAEVRSPTYLGGLWLKDTSAIVHPGKLCDGLRRVAVDAGVRVFEHSPVHGLETDGAGVRVSATVGTVRAQRVLLGTSAYPPLLGKLRHFIAPVYDYALMTEPLSDAQLSEIGWWHRQGLGDMSNQFHYYRLTQENRILFGGYDAVYRYGGPVADRLDDHQPTFAKLSQHFFATFPQVDGLRFTHRWGGAIDTCSRFSVFFGTALSGRVSYAVGYTGLGVGSTRWGAQVALDLLDGRQTEATSLAFVRRRPVPFPPEPLRSAVIGLTRNRLAAADRRQGKRGIWLGTLDRLGLGFDS